MLIRKFDRDAFLDAYDVKAQMIYPWEKVPPTPFSSAWGLVEPGRRVKPHAHHDGETFVIVQGRGVMTVDGESVEVAPGDVVYLRPFETHILENRSAERDLLFLTLWWEDRATLRDAKTDAAATRAERVLVTASPPTPNGAMHLGHLAGPYLGGDFHARYLRLRGVDVAYVCHTDDNESYVRLKAEELGLSDRATADRFTAAIRRALAATGIVFDSFLRPNETPEHVPMVKAVFRKLYDDGKLVAKTEPVPYCERCALYLFESYVVGRCPHCGHDADAFVCERCFRSIDCTELRDPRCARCGEPASAREIERLIFPLSRYADALREYWRRADMGPCVRSLCERMLAGGLPDVALSQTVGWGTPVPVDGFRDQQIYGAFEVFAGFLVAGERLAAARDLAGGWRRWFASDETELVQFFGSDNCFFFGVLYPALSLAYDPEIRLPARFVTNEYYLLEGTKFSTSLGHRILAEDMLEEVPADVLRFYLAWTAPETERTDFRREDFDRVVARELRGRWRGWLETLARRVREEHDGEAPATAVWTQDQRRYYQELLDLVARAAASYEAATFSPQRAARTLCEVVRASHRFGRAERHWAGVEVCGDERRTGVALELLGAKVLAILAAPILPGFAAKLWRALGYDGEPVWEEIPAWLPAGQKIRGLEGPYFE